ncbi:SDR family oxidoreductase [Comamonas humi]
MSTIVISGSASGIGAATRQALEAQGHQVIGIDRRGAEVEADLSNAAGRHHAVAAVLEHCPQGFDGLVLCAGLGVGGPASGAGNVVSVNYFGAVELLDGLLPALRKGQSPAAVVISSTASVHVSWDSCPLSAPLEAGDEATARAIVEQAPDDGLYLAYAGSKNALTVAVRRRAQAWSDAGVRLNTVAPGATETPLLKSGLESERYGQSVADYLPPMGRRARPEEMASVVQFLLSPAASYVHATQIYVDGGSDATTRPTQF